MVEVYISLYILGTIEVEEASWGCQTRVSEQSQQLL